MSKKAVLIVLDSVGIGELPDAHLYGDQGSNTFANTWKVSGGLNIKNLESLGIGNIEGLEHINIKNTNGKGSFGRAMEASKGKDTVTGHWEIGGVILDTPLNTYPDGFPKEIMDEFENKIGRKTLGNVVASGTEIIKDLGDEHVKTGYPIVYTSADSVFQIAAHEEVIPLDELYKMCEIARKMLVGEKTVGRVIARPFTGEPSNYTRTSNRHDYALDPFSKTMLEYLKENDLNVMAVGKIEDIFNKKGVTHAKHTKNNMDGVEKTLEFMREDRDGLIFTNLVDFDSLYGHRNNPEGYGKAIEEFDERLPEIIEALGDEDILIITADHGCDPTTESTDHSREYIPLIVYGKGIKENINIGTRKSFCDIGKSVLEFFNVSNDLNGESFYNKVRQ
ncbi:phosphopentomutase [Clostridium sp.]|uniref:phosphopentomutase n=1 Tax=Clostridium sp. TaxID=1506 RepID=UPI003463B423